MDILDLFGDLALHELARRWPWRRVPDVCGKTLDECEFLLDEFDLGLQVSSDPSARGLVTAQEPDPRTRVKRWSHVLVTVEAP